MVMSVNPRLCMQDKVSDGMRRCVEAGELHLFEIAGHIYLHCIGFPSTQELVTSPGKWRMWPGWQMEVWEPEGVQLVHT